MGIESSLEEAFAAPAGMEGVDPELGAPGASGPPPRVLVVYPNWFRRACTVLVVPPRAIRRGANEAPRGPRAVVRTGIREARTFGSSAWGTGMALIPTAEIAKEARTRLNFMVTVIWV